MHYILNIVVFAIDTDLICVIHARKDLREISPSAIYAASFHHNTGLMTNVRILIL